jgi:ribA/ribD-fused uncharacterized protein
MVNQIFFWNERQEYGYLSNFYDHPVEIDGRIWPTTEHYYAAMKTPDFNLQEMIRCNAETPLIAKRMGRKYPLKPDWEEVKYDVMVHALRAKFSDKTLQEKLLNTGDAEIYEDSPFDKIWGTGVKGGVGTGLNLLGKALMQVREELRKR